MPKKIVYIALMAICLIAACISATDSSSLLDTKAGTGASGVGGEEEPFEFNPSTTTYGGPDMGGGRPCYVDEINDEQVDLDMVVVLDRSGSMGNKWGVAVNALTTFFNDPKSSGLNVAITYFPSSASAGGACDVGLYNFAHVPVGQLPGHVLMLESSLFGEVANGGSTPIYGALKGTYDWVIPYQQSNITHRVIVVLASDGSPNSCPGNQNNAVEIALLAEQALNAGVETYVIGMAGASMNVLDSIAYAGGSAQAYDISSNATMFYDKMKEIQKLFNCEYILPQDSSLDMNKIIVEYISSISLPDWKIPRVSDASECNTTAGWYFDDNVNPSTITLCDLACDLVVSDPDPKLSFAFGCVNAEQIK